MVNVEVTDSEKSTGDPLWRENTSRTERVNQTNGTHFNLLPWTPKCAQSLFLWPQYPRHKVRD